MESAQKLVKRLDTATTLDDDGLVDATLLFKLHEESEVRDAAKRLLERAAPAAYKALATAAKGRLDVKTSAKLDALKTKKYPAVDQLARALARQHRVGLEYLRKRGGEDARLSWQVLVENGELTVSRTPKIPDDIVELEGVHALAIENCNLADLPAPVRRMRGLKKLSVTPARWRAIPDEIAELADLEELSVDGASLIDGLGALAKLRKLRVLSLVDCKMAQFTDELPDSLEAVHVHCNGLGTGVRDLPGSLARLPALRELTVSARWRLCELHPAIGDIGSLETLEIYAPEIDALPDSIGRLRKLKKLRLDCADLTVIPDALVQCTQLRELELKCSAPSLPEKLGKLAKLQRLELTGHLMKKGLPASFFDLDRLKSIKLTYVTLGAKEKKRIRDHWPDAEIEFDHCK